MIVRRLGLLSALVPLLAACAATPAPLASVPEPAETWGFEHSDIPVDPGFRFGTLANGMRYVVRANATPKGTAIVRMEVSAASLDEIYAASDYISLHTNLTPETRDMISAKSFAKMKKGVLILNCARGEIVHTADMVEALKSGQVGGYGTDVLDTEPPTPDHPLLKLPNVVCTPHVGSRTYESVVRQASTAVKNLVLAMNGEKPIAQVNPEVPVKKVV